LILTCLNENLDWYKGLGISEEELIRKLVRRGFLDSNLNLTTSGMNVLNGTVQEREDTKAVARSKVLGIGNFDEFWNAFPTTDKYAHHQTTRTLRVDRNRANVYYNRVIAESKITHETLMSCLQKDIEMRKRASLGAQNEFKYMPSTPA
jgi:hypothetical protein